ncbi:MAG: ABC transporter ATP-binding protein [Candidatus Enteromonas sp.]|nr:ABC transporter ATP-binding protein [Candidatus Enteromonas sp.]
MSKRSSSLSTAVKIMLKGHVGIYVASYVAQLFMVLSEVFSSFLSSVLVDSYMHQLHKAALVERWVADLIAMGRGDTFLYEHREVIGFWVLGSALVLVLMSWIRFALRARASSLINKNMQNHLYEKLLSLPFSEYKTAKPGDLIQTCTNDIDVIRKFLIMQASQILYSIWMSIFCSFILLQISWKLALASLALMPPLFLFSFFFMKKLRSAYRAADDAEAEIVDRINDNLSGVRVIKAFGGEQKEIDRFEHALQAYKKVSKYDRWLESVFYSTSDIFIFTSRVVAVCFAVYLVFTGEISGGSLAISFLFVNMMVWPLRNAAQTMSAFGQTLASSDRIQLLLNKETENVEDGDDAPLQGGIVFDHVSFSYPDDPSVPVIQDVSFSIAPGQTVAIMGKTGSGKSTLFALLTRLYETTSGTISVDGIPVKEKSKARLRKDIASVLQDPFLFSRSIEDNIRIAVPEASHESIAHVANIAHVDGAIERFDHGYDTPVGEKASPYRGAKSSASRSPAPCSRIPPSWSLTIR